MTTKGEATADSPAAQSFPQIIAAVDGSASSYHAVAWAAVEAVLRRRRLHILTSVALPGDFGPGMTSSDTDVEWMRRDGESGGFDRGISAPISAAAVPTSGQPCRRRDLSRC